MEQISLVLFGRNEEKTLPRVLASCKDIEDRIYLDTGSTDRSVEIAKSFGCRVFEVGDKFRYEATRELFDKFKKEFGFDPMFKVGERFFHFGDARNEALSHAKNDWCFQPDCDEEVKWDFKKVMEAIQDEDHLTYRFCFAHKPDGTCGLEFTHTKFFRKSKIHWRGWVHEVESPLQGITPKPPKYVDFIYHHHWQNHQTKRSNYLGGLELSCAKEPTYDRNLYYLAREYFYYGEYRRAIDMFDIALRRMWWKPERGQAYLFKSQCHEKLREEDKARECLYLSLLECDTRREPFNALGDFHASRKMNDQAVCYYRAALGVPFRAHGYLNNMDLYGWHIHDKLSQLYAKMGAKPLAKKEWIESLGFQDLPKPILSNVAWFYDCPLISIVVPTCRPEGFARLEKSIRELTAYPNYEIVKMDGDGTAVEKFNNGVRASKGEYIAFMADDTEVTLGWLTRAFVALKERLNGHGAISFNDGYWGDRNMGHFLASRDMLDVLGGDFWDPEFYHNGVDPLMCARLKAKGLAIFDENCRIVHHHNFCATPGATRDSKDEWAMKVEHFMDHDSRLLPKKLMRHGLPDEAAKWSKIYIGSKISGPLDIIQRLADMGIVTEGLRVLNIGLGDMKSGLARQLPAMRFAKITNVETHIPYIVESKKLKWAAGEVDYANEDIRDIKYLQGYDIAFLFDIIEHLPRDDAEGLLDRLETSGARVLAFVPIEGKPRENRTGVKGQDHLSFWTEADFLKRGYRTTLLPNFHGAFSAMWAWR